MPITRRTFLKAGGAGLTAMMLPPGFAWADPAAFPNHKLLVVFLRGGADGLDLVRPRSAGVDIGGGLRDNSHIEAGHMRPWDGLSPGSTKSITQPVDPANWLVPNHWELHPQLARNGDTTGLLKLFNDQNLSVVHAVGAHGMSHSHFTAQDEMERAAPSNVSYTEGWLNSTLAKLGSLGALTANPPALSGIGLSSGLPISLAGSAPQNTIAFNRVSTFRVNSVEHANYADERRARLETMYGVTPAPEPTWGRDPVGQAGRAAFAAMTNVENITAFPPNQGPDFTGFESHSGSSQQALNAAFYDAARLIMNWDGASAPPLPPTPGSATDLGVRAVTIDYTGWDTHSSQRAVLDGGVIERLAISLRGFWDLLTTEWREKTLVLVQSEFGRTLDQNNNWGTEHGDAGAMFVLGSRLAGAGGGKVLSKGKDGATDYAIQQGSETFYLESLERPAGGDHFHLHPTTDFRNVYAEILQYHLGLSLNDVKQVIPQEGLGGYETDPNDYAGLLPVPT